MMSKTTNQLSLEKYHRGQSWGLQSNMNTSSCHLFWRQGLQASGVADAGYRSLTTVCGETCLWKEGTNISADELTNTQGNDSDVLPPNWSGQFFFHYSFFNKEGGGTYVDFMAPGEKPEIFWRPHWAGASLSVTDIYSFQWICPNKFTTLRQSIMDFCHHTALWWMLTARKTNWSLMRRKRLRLLEHLPANRPAFKKY